MGIIRKTQSLEVLLNQFKKKSKALSTVELIKRLDKKLNKTTIYRVLTKLEEEGVLHSFVGINGIKWYAKCNNCTTSMHTDIHPHFECLSCGKVDCLDMQMHIPIIPDRKVVFSQLLIQGKCETCYA
jgi:Fur family ferric uptake transcriptional regulator